MFPILLVLADPTFRVSLMTALRGRGFTVVLHPDGEDARAYLDTNTVSLVIVDARLPSGETGDAWIRKRREDGVTAKMVLCGSTREEVERLVRASGDLNVESVVPKTVATATIVSHVEELVRAPAPAAASGAQGAAIDQLALLIEQTRLSIVQLQRGESRERVLKGIEEAKRLRTAATAAGATLVVTAAKTIDEILTNVRDGRQRLEHSAFAPMERGLLRARESLGAIGAQASTAPAPAARRASGTSAHVEVEEDVPTQRSAYTLDELTGLMTRDGFLQQVEERAEAAAIDGRPLSVCLIAVDDSARLRAAGTLGAVLKALGGFLGSRFRPDDVRGRWSPDACALAFPATPAQMAVSNMTRTLEAFDTLGIHAKLSAGVATFPKDGATAAAALAIAERRLQKAQAAGGGTRGP